MPATLYAMFTTTLIIDAGVAAKWWVIRETIYPFNEVLPLQLGLLLVGNLWILKFTYGRFWLYAGVELILSIGFAYQLQPFLSNRGIWVWINVNGFLALLPAIPQFITVYLYQMWQEGVFVRPERTSFSANLQPAPAAKPLPKDHDSRADNE